MNKAMRLSDSHNVPKGSVSTTGGADAAGTVAANAAPPDSSSRELPICIRIHKLRQIIEFISEVIYCFIAVEI